MRLEEVIAVVEVYIHHATEQEIRVIPPQNKRQHSLLMAAYIVAIKWVENNNIKLTLQL